MDEIVKTQISSILRLRRMGLLKHKSSICYRIDWSIWSCLNISWKFRVFIQKECMCCLSITEPGCNSKNQKRFMRYTMQHHFDEVYGGEKTLFHIKQTEIWSRNQTVRVASIDCCSSDQTRQKWLLTLCVIVWVNNYWLCTLRVTRYAGTGGGAGHWSLDTSCDARDTWARSEVRSLSRL